MDVLARLMQWVAYADIDDADAILRDAITEIAGLRARLHEHRLAIRRLAEQDATLSVCDGAVTVQMDATLTDAEREAITVACGDSSQWGRPHVATLMRLLERTR